MVQTVVPLEMFFRGGDRGLSAKGTAAYHAVSFHVDRVGGRVQILGAHQPQLDAS